MRRRYFRNYFSKKQQYEGNYYCLEREVPSIGYKRYECIYYVVRQYDNNDIDKIVKY